MQLDFCPKNLEADLVCYISKDLESGCRDLFQHTILAFAEVPKETDILMKTFFLRRLICDGV
jgi:hypothetical protein